MVNASLEFFHKQNICVSNLFFKTILQYKVSSKPGRHLCSKHQHQLDLILEIRHQIGDIWLKRSYHSPGCSSENSVVLRKMYLSKSSYINDSNSVVGYRGNACSEIEFKNSQPWCNPPQHPGHLCWSRICKSMHINALESFGKNTHTNKDWFV